MYALEIINALNDPDNPAKPTGLNVKLKKGKLELDKETGATGWTGVVRFGRFFSRLKSYRRNKTEVKIEDTK